MKHELMVIQTNTLQIIEIKNPFEPKKEIRTVPITNGTVFSYLDPNEKDIYYNGMYVLNPESFYPQSDGQLVVLPQVGKGLKQILGWTAMIALTVWAGGIGASWFGGTKAIGAVLLRGLASGAVIYLGGRIINSVFHIDQTNQSSETNYGWNLPTVQTTEGGVIGETFGEVMPTPQLLMEHVETNNSDDQDSNVQYLNLLLCGGWGPVDSITDLRIGTTGLEDGSFDDVQIETRLGTNDQSPISFFPDSVLDQNIGMQIAAGKTITRTTETNKAQRLDVTVEFPNGIFYVKDNGSYGNQKVNFRIEYRKTGDTDWINPVSNSNYVANTYQLEKATGSAIYRTYTIAKNLPAGQYDVRVYGANLPTGTRYSSYMQWNTLSSFMYDGAKTHPGKVLVALRIKATNQLSGSLPDVNWRQWRNTVYVWNPATSVYEEKSARNPIWAAYAILHGCKSLKNINTGAFEYVVEGSAAKNFTQYYDEWVDAAAYADNQIRNNEGGTEARFEFDAFYNSSISRWQAAQKAAAVGHATILRHGTQYGISVDRPGSICQIFGEGQTPVSSVKGSFSSMSDRAKAVDLIYNDTNNDFKNTSMKIYSPTYANDLTVQDNTPQVTLFGVKRRSQAYREGFYYLATNERQLQTVSFGVDIAGIVCQYGDIIGLNHAVPQLGLASGRIVSVSDNMVTLDKEVSLAANTDYAIMISLAASDVIITKNIVPVSEGVTTNTLIVSSAFDSTAIPVQFDPYAVGLLNKAVKPFRIVKTERDGDNRVTLTCTEYDEAVYDVDYSKYPVIDYTNPVTLGAPINLSFAEINYTSSDGIKVHILRVTWSMPSNSLAAENYYVYYSTDNITWKLWDKCTSMTTDITNVIPPGTYYVKVCAAKSGVNSGYVSGNIDLTGGDAPPNDVTGLTATKITSNTTQVKLSWAANTDIDLKGYRVYVNGVLHSNILTDTTYTYTADQSGQYTFAVVAVDNSDNESANQATVTDVITCEPADVTGFTVQQSDADRSIAVFNWAANKEVDLSYYEIRVGDTWDTGTVLVTKTKATTARYTLPASGSYTFWIKAINAEGFYSANAAQLVEQVTLEPDAVTSLAMAQSTQDKSKATLSWTAPAGGDIAYYAVKYGTSWDAGTLVAKTKEIKLTVALPGNGTWHYMVQAVTVAGYTSTIASTDITASIQPLDVTNFKAIQSATDRTRITLAWDAPAEVDVAYYIIKEGSNWDSAVIVSPRVAGTLYDVVVDDEAQHTWLIKAVTIAGNESQYAASVSGIYDLRPNPVASIQASQDSNNRSILNINWTKVTDGDLSGYQVKIGDNWDAGEPLPFTRELYATYTITSSGTFKVMIKAMNAAGYYSDEVSIACTVQVEPSNVTGLVAYQNGDTVELYWDKSPDNDVTGYEIREGYSFDSGALVSTGVANTDYTMAIDTARFYHYFVKAINSSGKYSKTAASVSLTVSNLSPRNVIQTFDEIALASGTHDNTEFGTSLINFQTIGGKWSDYPTTKFSEVGGSSVLKLAKEVTGTFTRNSVAYKEDGTQVAAGVARFGANGLLIEEGTTNYYGGQTPGSVRHGSATVSITEITTNVPAAGRYWQITGDSVDGTTANSWWSGMEQSMPALGTSFKAGDVITCSAWLKVATTALGKSVAVQVNKSDWTGALATAIVVPLIRDGKWHRYSATLTFNADYTGNPIFDIFPYGYVTDQNFTYYVGGYQVEKKSYATSTVPASFGRTVESLTVPGSVFSAEEGTLEFTINPLVVASYNNFFNFYSAGGRFLIWFDNNKNVNFDCGATNSGFAIPQCAEANTNLHIAVSWSASAGKRSLVVNGQSTQVDWSALDGFSAPSAINVVNNYSAWIKNVRFSNTAHSVEKMVADAALSALPVEDDTTCLLRLADTLDMYYGAGIYTSAVIDIASIITCNVTTLFTSSVNLKGGSAALQVRTSQDGTTWLDWEGFKPIQRTFRYIQFRILLETTDITKTPEVNQCIVSIDVPDTDIALTATISTGGTTVPYGHTYYTVPAVVPAAIGENLHAELISKTLSDCVIKIKNASNTDVGGTADIRIKGY